MGAVEAGGASVQGLGRTTMVDYLPGDYFGVAFTIKNRSDRPVTITGISGTKAGQRFVRLVGVTVVPFTIRPCPGSCPAPSLGLARPFRELGPLQELTVGPHRSASVILHFRWVDCTGAPRRVAESDNRALQVEYRVDGRTETQLLSTGGARLTVQSSTCGLLERP